MRLWDINNSKNYFSIIRLSKKSMERTNFLSIKAYIVLSLSEIDDDNSIIWFIAKNAHFLLEYALLCNVIITIDSI